MNSLNRYYSFLFKEAFKQNRLITIAEISFILIAIATFWLKGYFLYSIAIFGIIIQLTIWILRTRQKSFEETAHRIQQYSMLSSFYSADSFIFDISQIKGRIPPRVFQQIKGNDETPEGSKYTSDELAKDKLIYMIQENSFWNHHQFKKMFQISASTTLVIVSIILMIILLSIGTDLVDKEYTFFRILLLFFTGAFIYHEMDKSILCYRAAKTMLEIDNSISRQVDYTEEFLIQIFSIYTHTKSISPLINNKLYEKNKEKLNDAWRIRFSEVIERKNEETIRTGAN